MTRWRSLIVARAWLSQQREGSEQDDKRSQHELSFRAVDEESNGAARDPVGEGQAGLERTNPTERGSYR
jgi:hypothetical protein